MGIECDNTKKGIEINYIWIDPNINNSENSEYTKNLSKIYANISKISFFTNIKDSMKFFQNIKFNLTYIIVSGSLFSQFILELKNLENKISTVPKIIIFTSESTKTNIQKMKEINDSFYNIGGLAVTFS